MKKWIFVLMLVGLLSVVQGSQDMVELGPYNISFDLGDLNYTIEFEEPYNSETYSGTNYTRNDMYILAEGEFIAIITALYASPVRLSFGSSSLYDVDGELHRRTVDNKEVVMYVDETLYGIEFGTVYMLESDGWVDDDGEFTGNRETDKNAYLNGSNYIRIVSTMEWDLTRKLLNTIHVELRDES